MPVSGRTAAGVRASLWQRRPHLSRSRGVSSPFHSRPALSLPLSRSFPAALPSSSSSPAVIALRCYRHYCSDAAAHEKKRSPPDHRDLGVQQELFTTSVYSPGSPIFLPNGARIFNRLVDFLRKQYVRYGFQEVITPTIYKKALWARSGHLDNYADDMFTVTSKSLRGGEENGKGGESEADEYGLKPMNCPGHCLIFAAQRHSYRDLPIRYADFSPLHRNELSGALSGLTRVRRFHQDDGHIFCRPSQVEAEIGATLDFVRHTYAVLGLGPYRLVLSTRPLDGHLIGTTADWDAAEAALQRALDRSGQAWTVNPGDGAFYGPKIDIVLRDSDGKEHQTATVQLDFQLPRRFGLEYAAGEAEAKETETEPAETATPVLIHRAVLGSVERLMALLIEHYNGKWPFWLNPRQVMVLTVNDSAPVVDMARRVQAVLAGTAATGATDAATDATTAALVSAPTLLAAVDVDESPRSLPLKVREAKSRGYGVIVVVGPKDVARGTVAVDLSGILPRAGTPEVASSTATVAASDKGRAGKSVNMTAEELLRLLQDKVNTYQ